MFLLEFFLLARVEIEVVNAKTKKIGSEITASQKMIGMYVSNLKTEMKV